MDDTNRADSVTLTPKKATAQAPITVDIEVGGKVATVLHSTLQKQLNSFQNVTVDETYGGSKILAVKPPAPPPAPAPATAPA